MGCSTSRLDHLPAVSLCYHRCKFLEEALYQSYALADAHVAYMQSLKALGPALRRFFDQNLENNQSDSQPNIKPSPSPDRCPSSSNSDSHLDFPSDSEEEFGERDFDLLDSINPNNFDRQNPIPSQSESFAYLDHNKYNYYADNGRLFRSSPDGGSAWKTPSPPPPPSGSTWEFLNFFDTYERYDLPTKSGGDSVNLVEERKQSKPEMNVKQKDVPVLETKEKQEKQEKQEKKEKKDSTESTNRSSQETVEELEAYFNRAAESGNEVLKILDTGKFRYYDKNSIYQGVYAKKMHVVGASISVIPTKNTELLSSSQERIGSFRIDDEPVNLSSTLKKLCMWEKKLYDEVKAEEKFGIMLARNCRQMKIMGEKCADNSKVESARTLIRALSTKVKVAIQVIDRTSVTINKLRDEELWPLVSDLIHKLFGMWKAMAECHRGLSQAVVEAKSLDAIVSNRNFNQSHLESAIHLKIALQNWNLNFSNWINAQRCYVGALNSWLLKCFPYEPKEIPDEISTPPLAPPFLFSFCNQWSRATGKASETEVINAINGLFINLNQLVERHYINLADKNLEKRMKSLGREEKRMQRVLQGRGKKMFLGGGDFSTAPFPDRAVHRSEVTHSSSLHQDLKQIFEAIEKFSVDNVQIYEELHLHIQKGANSQLFRG